MNAISVWTKLRHALGSYPTTAREWAVRVQSSDVARHELLALDAWLKADPRNAESYARVNKVAHLGLMLRDHPEERKRLNAYSTLQDSNQECGDGFARRVALGRSARRLALAGMGALAASAAAVFPFIFAPAPFPSPSHYASGRGEQRQIALVDGSRVLVNTESEVTVNFSGPERAIQLEKGEAFFEVAKDPKRPFVVRTGSAEVRAIGTKFSVRRLDSDTEVVVTEGKVRVTKEALLPLGAEPPVQVALGHSARVGEHPVVVARIDTAQATAWTIGSVEFYEASLADVIRDVNRYTIKQFVVSDPALNEIRFSGRFHIGDAESVQFALKDRFGISATDDGTTIHLFR